MDFTEIYKQTSGLVSFSPGTQFILTAIQDRVVVRQADSFQIIRTWGVQDAPSSTTSILTQSATGQNGSKGVMTSKSKLSGNKSVEGTLGGNDRWITHAGWSCDSEYILAACAKIGVVEVFKIRDPEWRARIESGAEGLVKAEWAPDGRTVVCWSEWGLRLTVWSLVTATATYIQYPAHPERGYAFRADGHYLVLAERHKSKDTIGVYDATVAYRLVRHFPLLTALLGGLALSPTGNHIAVWEGPLEHTLYISDLAGNVLGTFAPERDPGFGVRTVAWHPAGLFLAVLGWDDKVHILESLTWGPYISFELQSRVPAGVNIWREPEDWLETTHGRGFLSYERIQSPHTLTLPSRDRSKPPPELSSSSRSSVGGDHLAWNTDGTLLLVRYGGAPRVVWLYSFPHPALRNSESGDRKNTSQGVQKPRLRTVLVHSSSVSVVRWNPVRRGSLSVCSGGGAIYLWSDEWVNEGQQGSGASKADDENGEEVAECVGVPAKKFSTHSIRWAPDGRGLILLDKDTFCCAFEVEDADVVSPEAI